MKKRIKSILNFVAFNLLFFALYLNFIHKDSNSNPFPAPIHKKEQQAIHINFSDQQEEAGVVTTKAEPQQAAAEKGTALKLSFN